MPHDAVTVTRGAQVATSKIVMLLRADASTGSPTPTASERPSGLKATLLTVSVCGKVLTRAPVAAFQMRTPASLPPEARVRPSGLIRTLQTAPLVGGDGKRRGAAAHVPRRDDAVASAGDDAEAVGAE